MQSLSTEQPNPVSLRSATRCPHTSNFADIGYAFTMHELSESIHHQVALANQAETRSRAQQQGSWRLNGALTHVPAGVLVSRAFYQTIGNLIGGLQGVDIQGEGHFQHASILMPVDLHPMNRETHTNGTYPQRKTIRAIT